MDLDESTVYTTETKNTSLTPLYAILQAKDHETERITQNQIQAQDQLIDQGNHHLHFLNGRDIYVKSK